MASRYFATVRRASVIPSSFNFLAIAWSLKGLRAFSFSTIVRIADTLDWDVPSEFDDSKKSLVKFGYALPPFM